MNTMNGADREGLISSIPPMMLEYGGIQGVPDEEEEYGTFHHKGKQPSVDSPGVRRGVAGTIAYVASQTTSILIITLVTIMDVLPYGLLIFPPGYGLKLNIAGVQLVLMTSAVSELVFALMSGFAPASGCMIVENVPFLHTMTSSILSRLKEEGQVAKYGIPTMFVAFGLSSILTGITFFLLGVLHLGKISSFVPRHVLLGCIGGMGVFIFCSGIGVSTGISWEWTIHGFVHQSHHFTKIVASLGLTTALNLINHFYRKPMVVPLFYICSGIGFFLLLWLIKMPISEAKERGWMFTMEVSPTGAAPNTTPTPTPLSSAGEMDLWDVMAAMNFANVRWGLICDQLFTIIGIVFFSVIHVPVNTPALANTLGQDPADLDRELRAHGISNLIIGFMGGLQNYMAYSISALYYKTGGGGLISNLIVAALLGASTVFGTSVVSYFPRPLAGSLLAHLGVALMWDALGHPWHSTDLFEYLCIVCIILSMIFIGFMEGLGIGVLMACGTFVVQGSRINPIHAAFPGDGIRSKEIRSKPQRKLLDFRMQGRVYVIRLRGNIFFGNSEQLLAHVTEVVHVWQGHLRFLLLDFAMVSAVDCNGRETLTRLSKLVTSRQVHIIWAGLTQDFRDIMRASGCLEPAAMMTFAKDLNKAFAFCEDATLESLSNKYPSLLDDCSPRTAHKAPSFLFGVLRHLTSEADDVLVRLEAYFNREIVPKGTILWRRNDPPTFACLLETGLIGVPRQKDDPSYAASIAQDPESRVRRRLPTFLSHGLAPMAAEDVQEEYVEYSLPGQFSGELGLFTKEARMYSCVAVQESIIWSVTHTALKSLLEEDPYLYIVLQRITLRYAGHRLHCLMLLGQVHSV